MESKRLQESKKAVMFLIVLAATTALFIFATLYHADAIRLIEKVWDTLVFYLGAQGLQDVAPHVAALKGAPDPASTDAAAPAAPTPTTAPDKYADK